MTIGSNSTDNLRNYFLKLAAKDVNLSEDVFAELVRVEEIAVSAYDGLNQVQTGNGLSADEIKLAAIKAAHQKYSAPEV